MKNIILTLLSFLLVSTVTLNGQNWMKGSIKGEGPVVKKELDLDRFDGVKLAFSGNVMLTQGNTQKVIIEAQQNIIDNIVREVKNGTWRIKYHKNVRKHEKVNVFITIPKLTQAHVSGSGNMKTTNHFSNLQDVELGVSGSGNLDLDLDADDISCGISGSGNVTLDGSADELELSISGSGNISAFELMAGNVDVSISGSGNADVQATSNLEVSVSGSGDVKYKGSPSVNTRVSGSGKVRSAQ
jgi:hypothetical protein